MSAERDAVERWIGRGIAANGEWKQAWAALDTLVAAERQAGRKEVWAEVRVAFALWADNQSDFAVKNLKALAKEAR